MAIASKDFSPHPTADRCDQELYRDDAAQHRAQVDVLAVAGDAAIALVCKIHLSIKDADEHLDRLALFKDCWPEYAGYRLLGGVPAAVPEDFAR